MKAPAWLVPWRKADQNTITPITSPLRSPSRWGWITEGWGGAWQSGMVIEPTQNLLAFSAVYACISLIAGDVSKLRARLIEQSDEGVWGEVTDRNSPFWPVLRKPNRYQTWPQFMENWMIQKLTYGNAYILKERDNRGVVRSLYPLCSDRVDVRVASDGSVFYQLGSDRLAGVKPNEDPIAPASEVIHDRMNPIFHPLCGVSPLYASGTTATQGIRIQANSEQFFKNMSRPSGMLTTPGELKQETMEKLKTEFERRFSGNNIGRIFVATNGLKFEVIQPIPAQDSQLIEQLGWTVEDVARAFGVPPYKIGYGAYPSIGNGVNQEYYTRSIQKHLRDIETLLEDGLGLSGKYMSVDVDERDLMRMDPLSRAEIADKRVKSATLTPNEARADEGLRPMAGGDALYLQQQNFSLEALAKRDAKDDPFADATTAPPKPNTPTPSADTGAKQEVDFMDAALIEVKGMEIAVPG